MKRNFHILLTAVIWISPVLTILLPSNIQTPSPTEGLGIEKVSISKNNFDIDWYEEVQNQILNDEYRLSPQNTEDSVYLAKNPSHNFEINFRENSVFLNSLDGSDSWQWGVQLKAYGYAGNLKSVSQGIVEINDNEIIYKREGLDEWYINDSNGLEQGFTIYSPPDGKPENEIVVELDLLGSLSPRLDETRNNLDLLTPEGNSILRFGQLIAFDANNKPMPVRMDLQKGTLYLIVQAIEITYPITIDPLATSTNWSVESNQEGAQLSFSVASAGDVNGDGYDDVIVGAPYYDNNHSNEGSVFVYHGSSSGLSSTPNWSAEGDQDSANFGYAVSSAGDFNGDGFSDIIIGATSYDNTPANEGAAFIWYGSPSGLTCPLIGCPAAATDANWSAESEMSDSEFGASVASAGDVDGDGFADVVIGAPSYTDNPGSEDGEGWAFVFEGGATPDSSADWSAESDQANAVLGSSVASAGDVNGDGFADIIIGAYLFDSSTYSNDGSAFVWFGSASGVNDNVDGTPANADWTTNSGQDDAKFGISVATAGDVNGDGYSDLIIGASGYTDSFNNEGRVMIYHGASSPDTTADWSADSEQADAAFGIAVDSAGDVNGDGYADVIVGSSIYSVTNSSEGSAFTWFGTSNGINAGLAGTPSNANWSTASGQDNFNLGAAVSTAGDVNGDGYSDIIVGVPGFGNPSPNHDNEGQALAFFGGSYTLSTSADWFIIGDEADAHLGEAVGSTGDINGDGYTDFYIAAWLYDAGGLMNSGRVYIFHGSESGPSSTADLILDGSQINEVFGIIAGTAGDVNADGYADFLVGSWHYSGSYTNEGKVNLYYGSPSGLNPVPVWTIVGGVEYAELAAASTAGDVNGDGYGDVIIGARRYSSSENNQVGAVFVFHGSADGLSSVPDWTAIGDQNDSRFGNGVGTTGDINGDGYDDIIAGGHFYEHTTTPHTQEGKAFVWYGSAHGVNDGDDSAPSDAPWSVRGNVDGANLGYSVSTAGDLNRDGYDDFAIIARYYQNGEAAEGAIFVWYGSATNLLCGTGCPVVANQSANWWAESNQINANVGYAYVDEAGDINGDGFDDLVVGAYHYDNFVPDGGAAFLWLGSPSGLSCGPGCPTDLISSDWSVFGENNSNQRLGGAVGTAGDINGDSYADLIIGATGYDFNNEFGAAYLFYGNSSNGFHWLPNQRSSDNSGIIIPNGQSISPDSVRLTSFAHHPFGRSNIRMQWEIKPINEIFDGTYLGNSTWVDSTILGTSMNQVITGLNFEQRYHWRTRLQGQPLGANSINLVTYQSPWMEGDAFLTALSGEQSISGTGITNLLSQSAYVNIINQGNNGNELTGLTLRGYPDTAHPHESTVIEGVYFLDRFFTIEPNSGAADFELTLCLNYDDDEIEIGSEDQLRLCRWTGTSWDCSHRADESNTTTNLVCAEGITALSDWAISSVDPLPFQNIELTNGWNMVSSYIEPENPNMWDVFASIQDDLVLAKNDAGDLFWPAFGTNDIGNWAVGDGYKILMTADRTLTITGTLVVPEDTPLLLSEGWNMISFLSDSPIPIETAFSDLDNTLILAKNMNGELYWPAFNTNNIGDMVPGQGYKVLLSADDTLIYPPY